MPTLHRSFPRLPPAALLLCSVLSAPAALAQSAPAAIPTGEFEQPSGEWNLLELVEEGTLVHPYVNGHLANVGTDLFPVTANFSSSRKAPRSTSATCNWHR